MELGAKLRLSNNCTLGVKRYHSDSPLMVNEKCGMDGSYIYTRDPPESILINIIGATECSQLVLGIS